MRAFALALLIALAPIVGWTQTKTPSSTEQEIKSLNAREVEALMRNDAATLDRLWSNDFVVTNPFNKFIDKKQVMAMTASGTLAFTSYDREIEYVRAYGDTVIVAGSETVVWAGKMPNTGTTSRLRFTSVWAKQAGRWQQIARHANVVGQ